MNRSQTNLITRNRAAALVVCAFIAGTAAAMAAPTPPNIVFIMADDMGLATRAATTRRAKSPRRTWTSSPPSGLRFTDAHTPAAVCTPTRYSVLTGRYCWRRKKSGVLGGYSPPLIENTRPTIASILKKQGYTTACIGKWHIGATFQNREGRQTTNEKDIDFTAPVTNGPKALGFDYAYWNAGCGTTAPPYGFIENEHFVSKSFSYQKMPHGDSGMVEEGWVTANADPILTKKACEFIRKSASANKPFFLYLAPNAPHEPCVEAVVPEFARGKSKAGHRGDLVWLFDWIVGQVVETLEATGQADNTMIIITSDNGALPGDYALDKNGKKMSRPGGNWVFEDFGHKSNSELRGYKAHIWEGGHRVPLIVRWPGKVKASTVSNEVICLTDFVATSAAIVGANFPMTLRKTASTCCPPFWVKALRTSPCARRRASFQRRCFRDSPREMEADPRFAGIRRLAATTWRCPGAGNPRPTLRPRGRPRRANQPLGQAQGHRCKPHHPVGTLSKGRTQRAPPQVVPPPAPPHLAALPDTK